MRYILLILFILLLTQIKAQNIGSRFNIENFGPDEYSASYQNWSITQGNDKAMYFANNDGVLRFNGSEWSLIKAKNVTKLATADDGTIYVGLLNDLGYLEYKNAEIIFTSLRDLLPDNHQNFGEVRSISIINNIAYFCTTNFLFEFKNKRLTATWNNPDFYSSYSLDSQLYIQCFQSGLHKLINDSLTLIPYGDQLKRKSIKSLFRYKEGIMIVNLLNGHNPEAPVENYNGLLFLNANGISTDEEILPAISEYFSYASIRLSDGEFAFGSLQNGLLIKDNAIFRYVNEEDGLSNSTIFDLYEDHEGNVWLAHNKGISKVRRELSLTKWESGYNSFNVKAPLTKMHIIGSKVYVGAYNGLFELQHDELVLVGFENQTVTAINSYNGNLIIATISGLFLYDLEKKETISIFSNTVWDITKSERKIPIYYYAANHGIGMLEFRNDSWINSFYEIKNHYFQQLVESNNKLWIANRHSGIVNFDIDTLDFNKSKVRSISDSLSIAVENSLIKAGELIYMANENGLFLFDQELPYSSEKIIFDSIDNTVPGPFFIDQDDNLLINRNGKVEVYKAEAGKYRHLSLFNHLKYSEVYNYIESDDGFIWFSTSENIYKFNLEVEEAKELSVIVNLEYLQTKDSVYNFSNFSNSSAANNSEIQLSYENNGIDIKFTSPSYHISSTTKYQYKLEGLETKWSNWEVSNLASFTKLASGEYTFKVKSKDLYENVSPVAQISFKISPPYYLSTAAMLLYVAIAILLIIGLYLIFLAKSKQINTLIKRVEGQSNLLSKKEFEILNTSNSLTKLKEEKKSIISIIGHDLKNTLNNMHSILEIFMRNQNEKDVTQLKYLSAMQKNIQRLRLTVHNVLSIEKLENRVENLSHSKIDLAIVLKEILESAIFSALEKRLLFNTEISEKCIVFGDEQCVREIFENLLSNAIKYSPIGKTVSMILDHKNGHVQFSIHNESQIIQSFKMSDDFSNYNSLSNAPTGGETSTGLGLSIVKQYIQAMNGEVQFELNDGFKLKFTLPHLKGKAVEDTI